MLILLLSIVQKVFPEAAAGHNQDPNFGLASDDSDDNEYDPDGSATDEQDEGDESSSDGSSSDDSDFTSTSDEVEAPADDKTYLGLSSEDSEDDEYNPDAPDLDDKVTQESSSSGSDFTSDSEDLAAVLEDNRSSGNDEGAASPLGHSNGQRYKDGGNNESLNNELLSIIKPGQDGAVPVYGKRSSERLDYKKLYDVSVISNIISCYDNSFFFLNIIYVPCVTQSVYLPLSALWIYFRFFFKILSWFFICSSESERCDSSAVTSYLTVIITLPSCHLFKFRDYLCYSW